MASRSKHVRAVCLAFAASRHLRDMAKRLEGVAEGFALEALTDAELQAVTCDCYARNPPSASRGLFPWEETWLSRDLPAAPCRLLLGGAGTGRELAWLRARGYQIVAFDPAVGRKSGQGRILELAYEDMIDVCPPPSRRPSLAEVQAGSPYAAIVLGWGSVTHVPGGAQRQALLRALRALSDGPLLMSYWRCSTHCGASPGRAHRTGRKLGRPWRGRGDCTRASDGLVAHAGYVHRFSRAEIEALAANAGYAATCFYDGYPHATLHPR